MDDFGTVADAYDDIYSSYDEDIPFYRNQAKKASGSVLEIAVGTGRVYLRLLADGVDAYGIDISGKMLLRLLEKARAAGLKPKVCRADMKNFRLRKKFSLIIIPFRAFLHNLTSDDQIATLKCLRRHLAPNGRIAMNLFLPSHQYIYENYGKVVPTVIDGKRGVVSFDKSYFIDEPNQIIAVKGNVKKKGHVIAHWSFRLALVYKKEFELLLRLAGFSRWNVYGGFKKGKLESSKQEMVWIIKK